MAALTHDDKETVRSLFAQRAIECDPDFDASLDTACTYIHGEVQNVIVATSGHVSTRNNYGRKDMTLDIFAEIFTDQGYYRLFAEYRWQNNTDEDADLAGFQFVYLINDSGIAEPGSDKYIGDRYLRFGLHVGVNGVETPAMEEVTQIVFQALSHRDRNALIELFCQTAKDDSAALIRMYNEANTFLEGESLSYDSPEYINRNSIRNQSSLRDGINMWKRAIQWRVKIHTTVSTYVLIVSYTMRDDWNPETEGLWALTLLGEEEWDELNQEEQFDLCKRTWLETEKDVYSTPGIYVQ